MKSNRVEYLILLKAYVFYSFKHEMTKAHQNSVYLLVWVNPYKTGKKIKLIILDYLIFDIGIFGHFFQNALDCQLPEHKDLSYSLLYVQNLTKNRRKGGKAERGEKEDKWLYKHIQTSIQKTWDLPNLK